MWKMYEREKVRARANICVVENVPLYVLQRFDDVILRKNDMEIWAFFLLSLEHLYVEVGLHSRVLIIFSLKCDTIFIYRLCWPSVFLLHGRWESGLCARESFPARCHCICSALFQLLWGIQSSQWRRRWQSVLWFSRRYDWHMVVKSELRIWICVSGCNTSIFAQFFIMCEKLLGNSSSACFGCVDGKAYVFVIEGNRNQNININIAFPTLTQ